MTIFKSTKLGRSLSPGIANYQLIGGSYFYSRFWNTHKSVLQLYHNYMSLEELLLSNNNCRIDSIVEIRASNTIDQSGDTRKRFARVISFFRIQFTEALENFPLVHVEHIQCDNLHQAISSDSTTIVNIKKDSWTRNILDHWEYPLYPFLPVYAIKPTNISITNDYYNAYNTHKYVCFNNIDISRCWPISDDNMVHDMGDITFTTNNEEQQVGYVNMQDDDSDLSSILTKIKKGGTHKMIVDFIVANRLP